MTDPDYRLQEPVTMWCPTHDCEATDVREYWLEDGWGRERLFVKHLCPVEECTATVRPL